jgi:ssDNA-binding Zn-finger/Zn-ribbon topoisomerase 1
MSGFPACDSLVLAVTLVLETPNSDIHECPACRAQCAVDRSAMNTAARDSQQVRIACHKCDMLFMPLKEDAGRGLAASSATDNDSIQSAPAAAADAGQTENTLADDNLRYGKCPKCTGTFLMPTTPVAEDILVECPHCSRKMPPLAIMRIDARTDIAMSGNPQALARPARRHTGIVKYAAVLLLGGGIIAALPGHGHSGNDTGRQHV